RRDARRLRERHELVPPVRDAVAFARQGPAVAAAAPALRPRGGAGLPQAHGEGRERPGREVPGRGGLPPADRRHAQRAAGHDGGGQMICPTCGADNAEGAAYCYNCSNPLPQASTPGWPPPPPTAPGMPGTPAPPGPPAQPPTY